MKENAKEQFVQALQTSFAAGQLHKCTLSKPVTSVAGDLKNIYIRAVPLKKGMHLAFNYRYQTRDEVKNFTPEAATTLLRDMLGNLFLNADLLSAEHDYSLQINPKGEAIFTQKKPSQTAAPSLVHNREKQRLLSPEAPWLHTLGITSAKGEVLANA